MQLTEKQMNLQNRCRMVITFPRAGFHACRRHCQPSKHLPSLYPVCSIIACVCHSTGKLGVYTQPGYHEAAAQEVTVKLAAFTDFRVVSVVGGQPIYDQAFKLRKGCEIIIATPGRLYVPSTPPAPFATYQTSAKSCFSHSKVQTLRTCCSGHSQAHNICHTLRCFHSMCFWLT